MLIIILASCLENDLCCLVEPFNEVLGEATTTVTLMKVLILKGRHQ